jgi:hypothetical protein
MGAPDIPGYTVRSVLGRGGFGAVWSAVPSGGGAPRAVKLVQPGAGGLEEAVREAALLREITHEHVLRLLEVIVLPEPGRETVPAGTGSPAGSNPRLALVLELAGGGSLAHLVSARGHLSPGELVTALSPVAAAMGDLHRGGIVHGDLSPGNVLFSEDGRPLVADLGVARIAGEPCGDAFGTAGFAAPELLDGAVPGPTSDVYSLGALTWFCLTGEPPAPAAVREPLPEAAPGTPDAVVEVVGRALSGDPTLRPTADQLATTLFDAARATPVRLAPGLDPALGITYRIRSGAEAPKPPARDTGRHRRRLRRVLVWAAVSGVVLGAGVGVGARWWHSGHGEGVAAEPTGGHAAAVVDTTGPTVAGHPVPVPTRGTDHRAGKRRTGAAELLHRRTAARTHPGQVLTRLVAGRARAWRLGSPDHLTRVFAPGSSALRRDRTDLRRVQDAGARYAGLSFTVTRADVLSLAPDTVRVRAQVQRSAYRIVRDGHPDATAARAESSRTVFELRWTGRGWRIADWS